MAILIGAGILVPAVVGLSVLREHRRVRRLRRQFGPEYARTIGGYPDREAAELELEERLRRHDELAVRDLSDDARCRCLDRFVSLQGAFEADPRSALAGVDALVIEILRARGYPVDSTEQVIADMSVDHPEAAHDYRAALALMATTTRRRRQMRTAFARYERVVYGLLDATVLSRRFAGAQPGAGPAAR